MKSRFDKVSVECSKLATRTYSTSFSLGIFFLAQPLRDPIYAVYGFVRFADEIVDSFHGFHKKELLASFGKDTEQAIHDRISLNPILNSFQFVVHKYKMKTKSHASVANYSRSIPGRRHRSANFWHAIAP